MVTVKVVEVEGVVRVESSRTDGGRGWDAGGGWDAGEGGVCEGGKDGVVLWEAERSVTLWSHSAGQGQGTLIGTVMLVTQKHWAVLVGHSALLAQGEVPVHLQPVYRGVCSWPMSPVTPPPSSGECLPSSPKQPQGALMSERQLQWTEPRASHRLAFPLFLSIGHGGLSRELACGLLPL